MHKNKFEHQKIWRMGRFLFVGIMLLVDFVFANKEPPCESTPPLKQIFQVVPHFKDTQFCNRICTSDYHVSDGGVRHISFTCKLKDFETASELCGCVYDYLNQKSWLDGATSKCFAKKDFAILKLTGQPDPTFDESNKDPSKNQPLKELKGIFDQFPEAELAHHKCRLSTSIDDCGCIHCKSECDLRPDSPCKEEVCAHILEYFNQDHWLDKSTAKCSQKGKLLHMDIIGDSKPGDECVNEISR